MSRVAVVTDTTHYLPREVIDRHGITLVSLYVNWEGRTDRESDLGDYDELLRAPADGRGRAAEHLAAVGGRLPGRLRAAGRGRAPTSSRSTSRAAISGTVRAAEQARDALIERGVAPERIAVLDSRTGCAGHGLMAIAAANAAAGGADLAAPRRRPRRCASG